MKLLTRRAPRIAVSPPLRGPEETAYGIPGGWSSPVSLWIVGNTRPEIV